MQSVTHLNVLIVSDFRVNAVDDEVDVLRKPTNAENNHHHHHHLDDLKMQTKRVSIRIQSALKRKKTSSHFFSFLRLFYRRIVSLFIKNIFPSLRCRVWRKSGVDLDWLLSLINRMPSASKQEDGLRPSNLSPMSTFSSIGCLRHQSSRMACTQYCITQYPQYEKNKSKSFNTVKIQQDYLTLCRKKRICQE